MNYAKPEMVKDTNYSDLYSTSYERWLDTAISDYKRVSEALDGTQSSVITAMSVCPTEFMSQHTKTAERLPLTTAAAMFRLTV